MDPLVYPRERTLGTITLVLGILAWLLLIVGTFGVALILLALSFVIYLFAQSALIAHIKGNGVELSNAQLPGLQAQFAGCCERLQLDTHPQAYILNGNGGLNAFATKFLGAQYVVLLSDVVDAMEKHADGVRFYIGHELGHLRMKHLSGLLLRWPVLWFPLLGAAYSRARESTCDRHGRACCASPDGAARALAALSAGSEQWQHLDLHAFTKQADQTSGFWMSFHELISGYPWLTKRTARVMDMDAAPAGRNPFAYLLALFIPYAGRLGSAFGFILLVYIVAVLSAIGIPAYQDYLARAEVNIAVVGTQEILETLGSYYETNETIPESLESLGIVSPMEDGTLLSLSQENMVLTATIGRGELHFVPSLDEQGEVFWNCESGEGLSPGHLPATCRGTDVE